MIKIEICPLNIEQRIYYFYNIYLNSKIKNFNHLKSIVCINITTIMISLS